MLLPCAVISLLCALTLSSCASSPSSGGGWEKTAGQTSCTEWLNEVSTDDQMTMAGDMVDALKAQTPNITSDASDMAGGITNACRAPSAASSTVGEMAALIGTAESLGAH